PTPGGAGGEPRRCRPRVRIGDLSVPAGRPIRSWHGHTHGGAGRPCVLDAGPPATSSGCPPNGYGPTPHRTDLRDNGRRPRTARTPGAHGTLQAAERRRVPHALAPQSQEERALTGGELSA